jgi:enediyne biosynthesis protein E4
VKARVRALAWTGAALLTTGCGRPAGFVDVAPRVGIREPTLAGRVDKSRIRETLGQGLCWTDHDRDGDPDLLVLSGDGRPWSFYENTGRTFRNVAPQVGLALAAWGIGCAAGDVDGDGWDDLFVTTAAEGNRLFLNRQGRFEDHTGAAGVGATLLSGSAAFGDLDADGDLDLFVAVYLDESAPPPPESCRWKGSPVMCGPQGFPPLDGLLYLNRGDGTFVDATRASSVAGHPGYGLGVVMLDADEDGDTDIYLANDSSPSRLFLNRGDATFEETGLASGTALSENGTTQAGMGVDAGDLDGDGRQDLVKTNFSDDINNFYRAEGGGYFSEWSHRSGLAAASLAKLGWAALLEDFDLDADLDLFVANGHVYPDVARIDPATAYRQAPQLFFNDGRGRLGEEATRLGPAFAQPILGRSAAVADFDGDLDMDIAVTRDGDPPLLLRNDLAPKSNGRLRVRLQGTLSNREGIGARVQLRMGKSQQVREMRRGRGYLGCGEAVLLFGLGEAQRPDSLTVVWPSGARQTVSPLPAGRDLVVREALAPLAMEEERHGLAHRH